MRLLPLSLSPIFSFLRSLSSPKTQANHLTHNRRRSIFSGDFSSNGPGAGGEDWARQALQLQGLVKGYPDSRFTPCTVMRHSGSLVIWIRLSFFHIRFGLYRLMSSLLIVQFLDFVTCRECSAIELSAIANWSCTSTWSRTAIRRCSLILSFSKRIFLKVVVYVYLIEGCLSQLDWNVMLYLFWKLFFKSYNWRMKSTAVSGICCSYLSKLKCSANLREYINWLGLRRKWLGKVLGSFKWATARLISLLTSCNKLVSCLDFFYLSSYFCFIICSWCHRFASKIFAGITRCDQLLACC